jgi:multidrug transporter EmrE-like cation transporter
MARSYLLLAAAVGFEVLWAALLKRSNGFSVFWASAVMVVAYLASLGFLTLACRGLDVSFAYAVWTGLGGALIALVGVAVYGESFSTTRALGVALVILGAILLVGFEAQTAGARS